LNSTGSHATVGYYLLLLIALRLVWRLGNAVPALPEELPRWRRAAARGAHWLLYFLMFFVSISGWMVADTFRKPIEATLFGFISVPHLLDASHRPFRTLIEENPRGLVVCSPCTPRSALRRRAESPLLAKERRASPNGWSG
jgi:cytochrome b561